MYIVSLIARYLLCLIPYIILVSNKDIIYHITGPITIPPFTQQTENLIYFIAAIELFRVFYQPLTNLVIFILNKFDILVQQHQFRSPWIQSMTLKYGFVLLMKLCIVFYEIHRLKYYLHVFFIELFMVAVNILADVVGNPKVSLVMDIVLIDSLNRVALFYQLTRTFNPNFGLYFFGNNLISLICFMLQGDKKQVLYVKHDIYRIMIVTFAYFFLFSLLQFSVTYRPLIIFILTAYFFLKTIQSFSNDTHEIKNETSNQTRSVPKIKKYRNFGYKKRQIYLYFNDFKQKIKNYFGRIRKNHAFLYFLSLLIIMIGLELVFIEIDSSNVVNQKQFPQQTVRNSFMEFYINMKQNSTQ